MRFLLVFRLYSGFVDSLQQRRWQPIGLPDVFELLAGLDRRGIAVTVVFLEREEIERQVEPTAAPIRFPELANVEFHVVAARRMAASGRLGLRLARLRNDAAQFRETWRRFCRAPRPDLVYLDRRSMVFGAVLALLGFRTVLRFHGVSSLLRRPAWQLALKQPLYWLALKVPHRLALSSEDGTPARPFFDAYLSRRTPSLVLVNGVDLQRVAETPAADLRGRYGFDRPWPVLLFVGRLTADKGAAEFLDGLARLDALCPRFYVVIVAGGSDTAPADRALAAAGLSDRAAVVRQLSHREVLGYFKGADIFVSTNRLANLTNTVLEALACGLAVAMLEADPQSRADESTAHLIPDDVAVRLGRHSTAADMASRLAPLLQQPARLDATRERVRRFAAGFLRSWGDRIALEIGLLEAIAQDRRPRLEHGASLSVATGQGGMP